MKFNTIKDLVFTYIRENNGNINFEDATSLVLEMFPNSEWKKTHWAWYKNQIVSPNGKYYHLFSEDIRKNISSKSNSTHYKSYTPNTKKNNLNEREEYYIFDNYSENVEKTIAICLGKICHHIHPEIIKRITEANVRFKNGFKNLCPKVDVEVFFYEGSDCVFPGVRRPINKEKEKKWKNNICSKDNMILNDNTFPRHIWSFLSMNKPYNGDSWKKSGLEQFELAHIFGHKIDEKKLEKKVFNQYDETKLPYALFTSASNVVLIPNGLMKPTDKSESIKIAFYKRHIELYGNNLYSEKQLNVNSIPKWYSEIEWREPVLPNNWEEKIDNLLEYRMEYLEMKYNTCL